LEIKQKYTTVIIVVRNNKCKCIPVQIEIKNNMHTELIEKQHACRLK
jgi:hypothetical protein